jgi:excisionase family DNA binding protein
MEKTLFSTPELAQWLGVFHTTVRRWIEKGTIKGIRVGRNYKIPADEVIRILEGHGIPLPDVVKRYSEGQKKERRDVASGTAFGGSILQKLLVVEKIEAPAFICRRSSVLVGNQVFADLVGWAQTDLIGLDMTEIVEASSLEGLVAFAQKRVDKPDNGPSTHAIYLKTRRNGTKKAILTAGSLDHMGDVFLLIVKEV